MVYANSPLTDSGREAFMASRLYFGVLYIYSYIFFLVYLFFFTNTRHSGEKRGWQVMKTTVYVFPRRFVLLRHLIKIVFLLYNPRASN